MVSLQITELPIILNYLNWNKTHALESKPIKPYQIKIYGVLKNGKCTDRN